MYSLVYLVSPTYIHDQAMTWMGFKLKYDHVTEVKSAQSVWNRGLGVMLIAQGAQTFCCLLSKVALDSDIFYMKDASCGLDDYVYISMSNLAPL